MSVIVVIIVLIAYMVLEMIPLLHKNGIPRGTTSARAPSATPWCYFLREHLRLMRELHREKMLGIDNHKTH